MKIKSIITLAVVFGIFLFAGIASASDTELLQPASTITYNEDLTVNGTGKFNSVYIGETGVGGVTFFNGTIVNIDQWTPVTFGDDVRIDGELWRGPSKGISDGQPLKISDTMIPTIDNINDLGWPEKRWQNVYYAGMLHGGGADFSGDLTVSGSVNFQNNAINAQAINDGSGSGLNADMLDGHDTSYFSISTHNHDLNYVNKINPTWNAITSYIALSAADFQPIEDGYDYINQGEQLINDDSTSDYYRGRVQLPHNATVTGFEFGWKDTDGSNNATIYLRRAHIISHTIESLASLSSSGSAGVNRSATAIINNSFVDNYNYRYYLELDLPTSNTIFYNAKISYTVNRPY